MNLARDILLRIEKVDTPIGISPYSMAPEGCDHERFAYHVHLLSQAGLVEAEVKRTNMGPFTHPLIYGLTWHGHEFLDSSRDDTVWNKARERFLKPGISWTFSILAEFLKVEAKRHLFAATGLLLPEG